MSDPANSTYQQQSPYELALANIDQQKWNRYKQAFQPVEKQYMAAVDQMNSPQQENKAGAMAQSAATQATAPTIAQNDQNMIEANAAPNSGKFIANNAGMAGSAAKTVAQAGLNARLGQQDTHTAGLENTVAIGNGQSTMAQAGMQDLARQGAQTALTTSTLNSENAAAGAGALGTAAGVAGSLGLNAYLKNRGQ